MNKEREEIRIPLDDLVRDSFKVAPPPMPAFLDNDQVQTENLVELEEEDMDMLAAAASQIKHESPPRKRFI